MISFFDKLIHKSETRYEGKEVTLKLRSTIFDYAIDNPKVIYYSIINKNNDVVGYADLRVLRDNDYYYYGDIGYHIYERFRGHNYAYYACKILFEIAKNEYHMNELIITCSPNNVASYKTLTKLDGQYIETVEVPKHTDLYRRGETTKCIFKFEL